MQRLNLSQNQLTQLPESLAALTQLQVLDLSQNQLTQLPELLAALTQLQGLYLSQNRLTQLPQSLGALTQLQVLSLSGNKLNDLPESILQLEKLIALTIKDNPLNPDLAAANAEGLDAVRRYLRAKAQDQVALNEAKLVLIGEGEVGKTCLLGALRNDPWVEGNPTTHGIEIKPVEVTAPGTGTKIMLNGWDFGGQRIYRPTHQLFFSAPAIYLVVWKPREGAQQGFVKEWITLVKHRAPEAKILVVATHGGPNQRQPDIDRQDIWDLFGKDMVADFFLVDNKPDANGQRKGIDELKELIARLAASLPGMGRKVSKRWQEVRQALAKNVAAYLPLSQVLSLCRDHKMDEDEAKDFVRISHRLGHLIHYEHDPLLQDIVVLKPDWLSKAISFVLDDEETRKAHGLVSFARLGELWDDLERGEDRYPSHLHPVFLRLMERYDLSYRVAEPNQGQPDDTSLIAQLVPDVRPESELNAVWPSEAALGEEQQLQICRIVDAKSGQSATAEGLFFQLIVRLHKYSLGCLDRNRSVHWQRGLVLDDGYNGRALLEHTGYDIRITVRAVYPPAFLSVLTHEVKWLVENPWKGWKGLRCEVTVPCIAPCGKGAPGTALFEVEKLISRKRKGKNDYPCPVSGCDEDQDIDVLLSNAPAARRPSNEELLAAVKSGFDRVQAHLVQQDRNSQDRFQRLDQNDQRILSQADEAYTLLMQALTDEAKDGPRLFSFEPVDPGFLDKPKWVSTKFRLTLWCEHSRLPLPALNGKDDPLGVYELDLPRNWLVKSMPYVKFLSGLLSLVVPVAAAGTKFELDELTYKGIEKQLDFGEKGLELALKGSEKAEDWLSEGDAPRLEEGSAIRGHGAVLRQLHAWLNEKDPSFGGLVKVQNRRQEFLWVHPKFEGEY